MFTKQFVKALSNGGLNLFEMSSGVVGKDISSCEVVDARKLVEEAKNKFAASLFPCFCIEKLRILSAWNF